MDSNKSKSEVNLFTEPHNRMKELVSWPLAEAAQVSDVHEFSLQAIYEAMWEMKTHEYIENHYIMDQLKQRLQSKRVYNELVCNCHEDSKLLEVISLVEKVYQADTQRERVKFGRRLQKAIKVFLQEFVTHMEEEESVFQPLLVENFDSKELKDMKAKVEEQHSLFRERVKSEKSLKALKRKHEKEQTDPELNNFSLEDLRFKKSYCQEVNDFLKNKPTEHSAGPPAVKKTKVNLETDLSPFEKLPEEILVVIFSHLSPKSLINCGAVSQRWQKVAFSSVFWRALYPTQWARGQWSFDYLALDLNTELDLSSNSSSLASSLSSSVESLTEGNCNQTDDGHKDNKVFEGIGNFLLPRIGWSVSTIILSGSKTLTNFHVQLLLRQVPNVRHVNLGHTCISSEAFDKLAKYKALRKVEELILSGCNKVGDSLFAHLASCFKGGQHRSRLKRLNLSGCRSITSLTLEHLMVHSLALQDLDLSGCYKIDGETLSLFVSKCARLRPEKLAYCNDIEDGPFQESANGCLNLECELRFCCQRLKN